MLILLRGLDIKIKKMLRKKVFKKTLNIGIKLLITCKKNWKQLVQKQDSFWTYQYYNFVQSKKFFAGRNI